MSQLRTSIGRLSLLMGKFAIAGALASVVNFAVFNALIYWFFGLSNSDMATTPAKQKTVVADMVAYACGVLFNYTLHKRFIFEQNRSASVTFVLYILVSAGGMAISAGLTWLFLKIIFFAEHPYIMKVITMGLVFVYNFFSKRFAFEKRLFSV